MRNYLLVALLSATVATPAFAQDAAPFTGPRVEAIVGYETTDVENENSGGVTYGGAIGYDFQLGGAVAGIEAELTDSTVDECISGVDVTGDELCAQLGRDIYVGGRIGAVLGSSTLLYAKAGYVNGRVNLQYDAPGSADDFDDGVNLDGVRVGAGVEFALSGNAYAKTEYRYSNYEAGYDKHQVIAGIGFRF
jgi:outer membrane immunogenic protein